MTAATAGGRVFAARVALPGGHGSRRPRWPSPARRLVFAAALALVSALAAGAQSGRPEAAETAAVADAARLGELSLTELMALKVTTVLGASRYEQSLRDAPSSVTIVTDDEIVKHGYRTLAEILRSVRGIQVRYDRNYSYIGVRGFDRAGDLNTRILLLVDGHRVAENFLDGNYIGTDFVLDTGLIDHVEVIRGPGSALYGSSAFSAVVNVVSKRARQVGAGSATVGAGSFDTYKGGFVAGGRSAAGIEYLASASALRSGGPARLYFPEFDAPGSHGGIVAGADGDEARNVAAKVSYQDLSLEAIYGWRRKGVPTASYGTVFGDARGETVDSTGFLDLGYNHESAGGLSTQVHLNFTRQTYDGVYIYDVAEAGEPAALVRNIDEQVGEWFGAEVLFAKRLARRHRLIAGAEWRDNTRQEAANFDQEPRFVYSRTVHQSRNWGLFVQDEVALHPRLSLTAGLRHDQYPEFGGTTNPRLALIYRPWPTTVVKALYGEAFRAPSLYETDWADPASKPNGALLPEKIATTEIVFERQLPASFLLSMSAYRSRIDDLIGQQTDPEDGLLVNRNLSGAESRGVELELARNLPNGLEGRISWAFQRSADARSGRSLENSPRYLGKLVLSLPLHRDALFFGLDAQYSSAVETVRAVRVDGYWLANATLLARPSGQRVEVALSFYNLFDQSYAHAVGDEHLQDAIPQDGRTFDLRLTYRF